ncbi:MAG: DivIVA domain-containing protein [Rhodothermales bacterium]|nr:DivIVA domain-containing protein [Rhodothermales bacterium]MBO6781557.1 DivIVA domain-containing protein [Rhodothermales bacterium]
MKLTALEIRKHEFARAFRGYDAEEVDAFLNMVAQHWQTVSQDMKRLEERLEEQAERINHYQKVEEALQHAVENAASASKEKLAAAETEAETRISDATTQAESTVRDAESKAEATLKDAESRATAQLADAEERASRRLSDAEQRASEALETAERRTTGMQRVAEERLRTVIAEAEARLETIQQAAEAARRAANRELERVESERQRLLQSFEEFMKDGLAYVGQFQQAVPPPELKEFEQVGPSVGPADVAGLADEVAAKPVRVSGVATDAVPAPQLLRDSDGPTEDSASQPASPERSSSVSAVAGGMPPAADALLEAEGFETEDGAADEAPEWVALDDGPSEAVDEQDAFLDELPSADDGFEDEAGSDMRLVSGQGEEVTPAEDDPDREFGAEEEIEKIRRILEDLDN